jgi:toxin ParE1/3/4
VAGYVVLLTEGAERDLEEIHRYVAKADSRAKANQLLDRLLEVAEGLETLPERGRFPEELQGLGVREYRASQQEVGRTTLHSNRLWKW